MTISVGTSKTSSRYGSGDIDFPSFTPPANSLLVITARIRNGQTTTVTWGGVGNGVWTKVTDNAQPNEISVWYCEVSGNPSNQSISIVKSSGVSTSYATLDEFTSSNGQPSINSNHSTVSFYGGNVDDVLSTNLLGFESPTNWTFVVSGERTKVNSSDGFTELANNSNNLITHYKSTEDTTPSILRRQRYGTISLIACEITEPTGGGGSSTELEVDKVNLSSTILSPNISLGVSSLSSDGVYNESNLSEALVSSLYSLVLQSVGGQNIVDQTVLAPLSELVIQNHLNQNLLGLGDISSNSTIVFDEVVNLNNLDNSNITSSGVLSSDRLQVISQVSEVEITQNSLISITSINTQVDLQEVILQSSGSISPELVENINNSIDIGELLVNSVLTLNSTTNLNRVGDIGLGVLNSLQLSKIDCGNSLGQSSLLVGGVIAPNQISFLSQVKETTLSPEYQVNLFKVTQGSFLQECDLGLRAILDSIQTRCELNSSLLSGLDYFIVSENTSNSVKLGISLSFIAPDIDTYLITFSNGDSNSLIQTNILKIEYGE